MKIHTSDENDPKFTCEECGKKTHRILDIGDAASFERGCFLCRECCVKVANILDQMPTTQMEIGVVAH